MGKRSRGAADQNENSSRATKAAKKVRRSKSEQLEETTPVDASVEGDSVGSERQLTQRAGERETSTCRTSTTGLAVEEDWAPLADRLNPTRKAFDPSFKQQWDAMSKKQRKKLQKQDRQTIAAMKERGRTIQHAFAPDPNDHCETSPLAYRHIAPILQLVAAALNKPPASLRIWDPYFCAGSVQRHLKAVGFPLVHNVNEDFYRVVASGALPEHDVLVTNPPYTADHVERFLRFAVGNRKPWFLLVPDYFAHRSNYAPALGAVRPFYLCPRERYHYWTPDGLREESKVKGHRNLALGRRNSPFVSYLLRPIYMEYSYVEFVCKCIYVYFTFILDGAGTGTFI